MIYLVFDHRGINRINVVKQWLTKNNYEWTSVGPETYDALDNYVTFVEKANRLVKNPGNFGIYMCGTGVGVSIAANRAKGVRAVLCNMPKTAYFSRVHNNANVICLSAGYKGYPKLTNNKMLKCIHTFLTTEFEGGRHTERVNDLDNMAD